MTQAELEAMPEFKPFSFVEKIIDGRRMLVPVANECKMLYTEAHEPLWVNDVHGCRWRFVESNGIKHRMREGSGPLLEPDPIQWEEWGFNFVAKD
jgi:hypothetical protein